LTAPVLVIGAGSIGARHARNLAAAGADVSITDVDADRAAALALPVVPYSLSHLGEFAGIVVASPTSAHAEQASAAVAAGVPVLVEKPLALSLDQAGSLATSPAVMVGYNLRFHEPIRTLRALTTAGRAGTIRTARFWFGSYLPDWRPAADYRATYSARRELGGGVLLDAIHELDLAVWWFGPDLKVVAAAIDRLGSLDIDVEDSVHALLHAEDPAVTVEVSLDYLSRRYRRGIELVGDMATLRLDWARGVIEIEDREGVEKIEASAAVDSSYEREAIHFLDWIEGRGRPHVDGREGGASLRLADDIRVAGS
jgi:predicted dehydrogenase